MSQPPSPTRPEPARAAPELAVLGASPAFAEPLHVGRPNPVDRRALYERIDGILDRNWLTNDGPLVRELEVQIAALCGVRHCVAMCNGTTALGIAARALGLQGEVIVPSFTFVATAHALKWHGMAPVFCDIDPRTHLIDPGRVEALITPRTTGIIGVHTWGRACDVDALQSIASRRGLTLLFDAAHAIGCSYRGRRVGSFGAAEVLSFQATKVLSSFEGGAVVTDDAELAATVRRMKNFGFARQDEVVHIGTNGKLSEVSAAMALTGLSSLVSHVAHNRQVYDRYREVLSGLPGVALLGFDPDEQSNYQFIVVEVDQEAAGLGRDELVLVLQRENVLARKYFWPGCHRMEPYRSLDPSAGSRLPETERVAARVMVLPTGMAVDDHTVETIGRILEGALARTDDVRRALANPEEAPECTAP